MSSQFSSYQRRSRESRPSGLSGYAMLRVHHGSNKAYAVSTRAQRPKLNAEHARSASDGLRKVALPALWVELLRQDCATYSNAVDGTYEITTSLVNVECVCDRHVFLRLFLIHIHTRNRTRSRIQSIPWLGYTLRL